MTRSPSRPALLATSTPAPTLTPGRRSGSPSAGGAWCSALALALALPALGCDGEGALAGTPGPDAGGALPTAQPGVDAGPPETPIGPRKRTIETRNPFGGPSGNLMADGDFELSATYVGAQAPWRGFGGNGGEVGFDFETGGLCRSGLRCAVLRDGVALYGTGTAAPQLKRVRARLSAKVPVGATCDVVTPLLVSCADFGVLAQLVPQSEAPGADGWCLYEDDVKGRDRAICMYVDANLDDGQTALVDAAVLEPHDGTVPLSAEVAPTISEATALRLARIRDDLRRRRPFGKVPEPPKRPLAP